MRTRSRLLDSQTGVVGICHQKWYNPDGSLHNEYDLSGPPGEINQLYSDETITDDPKGRGVKGVTHTKYKIKRDQLDSEIYVTSSGSFLTTGPNAHWLCWGAYGDITESNLRIEWPGTERKLIRETQNAFYDNNEVDSLLNAVESPELITSIRPLYNRLNGLKRLDRVLDRRDIRKILHNAKGTLGLISGGFLYYSFGIAPLISDMRKISKSLATYKAQAKRAIAKAGTVSTVHRKMTGEFTAFGPNSQGNFPAGYGTTYGTGSVWHAEHDVQTPPTMICTIRGVRTQKFQTEFFSQLDYLISRFGATGPASFAWERIPFSFVLDWFVDLSGVLNTLDNALTGSNKGIRDICISTKYHTNVKIIKHLYSSSVTSNTDGRQTAQVELSRYHRGSVTDNISVGSSGRFGKKQGLLTAALLGQMAANLKRKR